MKNKCGDIALCWQSFPKRDLPHPEDTSLRDTSVNGVTDDDDDGDDVMIVSEANNNVPKLTNGRFPVQSPNNSYGSDCDLSSVNRILDATDGTKFQALLCLAPGDRQLTSTECDDDSYQGHAFQSTPEPASFKVFTQSDQYLFKPLYQCLSE